MEEVNGYYDISNDDDKYKSFEKNYNVEDDSSTISSSFE